MKRILKEEEYNQIISLGKVQDNNKAKSICSKLYNMGIDCYLDNDELYIQVEQDRNDPHYVDDVYNMAKKIYDSYENRLKLACSKQKLTPNELNFILKECVKKLTEASVFNDAMFAIVKAQAKKMAFQKIKKMFAAKRNGEECSCKSKFDKCALKLCDFKNYMNEKECVTILCNAIDKLMDDECRMPDLSEYDMFSKINNYIGNYLNL